MSINFDSIRNNHSLLETVSRYVELVRRGNEYVGLCPFHADSNPSFTIYRGSNGVERYRCFSCGAGHEGGDVIDFVAAIEGLEVGQACKLLEDGALPAIGTFDPPPPLPDESETWMPIVPVPADAPPYDPAKTWNAKRGKMVSYRPSRMDPYYGHKGELLCYVVRLDFSDGQKICPTITFCAGPNGECRWVAKRMPPPFPLHGLDDLAKRPLDCVLLVSGEKCREKAAARLKNFVVVSWMGGDQTVESINIRPLVGRNIVYAPDADASSKRSMVAMHNRITQAE